MPTAAEIRAELVRREMARRAMLQPDKAAQTEYEQMPWYSQAATAADDTMRILANRMTLGGADKLSAWMGEQDSEGKTADAYARAGSAGIPLDILGLLAPSTAASKAVGATVPSISGTGLLSTILREGIAGTATGAGEAAIEGDDIEHGMKTGATGGVAAGILGTALGKLVEKGGEKVAPYLPEAATSYFRRTRVPAKSSAQLAADKEAAYDAVEQSGIRYGAQDTTSLGTKMARTLKDEQIDRELHPGASRRGRRFRRRMAMRKGVSLNEMDQQRQLISRDVSGRESSIGQHMREVLDEFLATTNPAKGGKSAMEADALIKKARDTNRRLMISRDLDRAESKSLDANSYAGESTPYKRMLNDADRGYTPQERAALQNVVRGEGWEEGVSRHLAGLAGHIGSIGSGMTAGSIVGGPMGMLLGGVAAAGLPTAARAAARGFRTANLQKLRDIIGEGKTVDSAAKRDLTRMGGAGGAILQDWVNKQRKKRRGDVEQRLP